MKKDKEWLKNEINKVTSRIYGADFNTIKETDDLIDQLYEPETLSQEWIDEHEKRERLTGPFGNVYLQHVVPSRYLQNLLVPKQEKITAEQVWKVIADKYGDELLQNNIDYAKSKGYLDGYTVEKKKLYRVKVDRGPNYLYVESLHLYKDVVEPLDFYYKFSVKENALKFANRIQAKGVAELVGGEAEEITE